ncbi:MAG: FHA domain-containing protein [Thermoguttaceae bacterium]|jgi:predicted component of type VI protein secretion system
MEVKLLVVGGKQPGQEIPVPGPKFVIGRGEDCQLRPRSEMVSRRHCEIVLEEGSVTIRDLGSRNGTLVNGEPTVGARQLKSGDRLKVGPLEFDVQLAVSVGGKKKPRVKSIQEAAARTVASAGGNEDLDITSWLSDEDDATISDGKPAGAAAPARADTAASDTHGPHDVAAQETQEGKKTESTPVVGRFQAGGAKPMADSSRSAAADMLKQFFNRKP